MLGGRLETDRLEAVVDTVAGEFADEVHGVAGARVNEIRRPEGPGQLTLGCRLVDRDDAARTREERALDDVEAHSTRADDGHGRAGAQPSGAEDGAEAGRHATAEQRRPVERNVLGDLRDGVFVDEHPLGEGRDVEELGDVRAGAAQPLRLTATTAGAALAAQHHPAGGAVFTRAAEDRQAGDDVVAGLDIGDVRADLQDHAGSLVADDRGHPGAVFALHVVQIAVADTRRSGLDEDLAGSDDVMVDVVDDDEIAGGRFEYRSLHNDSLGGCPAPPPGEDASSGRGLTRRFGFDDLGVIEDEHGGELHPTDLGEVAPGLRPLR